jgi:hypothetical protein
VSAVHRGAAALAGAVFLCALGACNLIVGAGDYVVGDAGTAMLTGNDATTPAPDGGMTSDDTGVVAMPDGTAPLVDGASSVDASPSLEAGSTVQCGVDGGGAGVNTASFKQLVTACIIAESCDPAFFDVPLSECITEDYLEAFPATACLASATSCDDYYNCTGSRIATLTECDGSSFDSTGVCTSGVSTSCPFTGGGTVRNCNVLGGTCTAYPTDMDNDVLADCKVLPSCTDSSAGYHCATATEIYSCNDTATGTIALGNKCPTASSCTNQSDGTFCVYNSPSCATVGNTCDSEGNLTVCAAVADAGNEGAKFRCAVAGLPCVTDMTTGLGDCVAPGCQNDTSCTESCDDDGVTIHTCIGGARYDIDCSQYGGFTGCGSDSPTDSSVLYPYCVY